MSEPPEAEGKGDRSKGKVFSLPNLFILVPIPLYLEAIPSNDPSARNKRIEDVEVKDRRKINFPLDQCRRAEIFGPPPTAVV